LPRKSHKGSAAKSRRCYEYSGVNIYFRKVFFKISAVASKVTVLSVWNTSDRMKGSFDKDVSAGLKAVFAIATQQACKGKLLYE
jgi:hypothetical protein